MAHFKTLSQHLQAAMDKNTYIYIYKKKINKYVAMKLHVPCVLIVFTPYNQQMDNIFNTYLYLKAPTFFDASMHKHQEVLLLYQSYLPVKIQFISAYT
jgi:hypothetical protein